jgi:Tfp pilus assembly protein PilX
MGNVNGKDEVSASRAGFRRGSASIYIVVFTTLLVSVITLGFVRIILSEARQTSNYDLSQSAYDSALAGIEDAKIALLKYHDCLSTDNTRYADCATIVSSMQNGDQDCDTVRLMLGRDGIDDKETFIESSTNDNGDTVISEMDQAYTCVLLTEITPDYLTQLDGINRVRMIPLRTDPDKIDDLSSIEFRWFSLDDGGLGSLSNDKSSDSNKAGYYTKDIGDWFPAITSAQAPSPPPVVLELIQVTEDGFYLSDLNTNKDDQTNRGTLVLYPSLIGVKKIDNSSSVGLAASADKSINNPVAVNCSTINEYQCGLTITLPKPRSRPEAGSSTNRNPGSVFLKVTLPYGAPTTNIKVTLNDSAENLLQFVGVQARVDSTGRTSDLFRRLEARIELVDTYFPFPEFAVSLSGGGDSDLDKNFWVTKNNWNGGNYGSAY